MTKCRSLGGSSKIAGASEKKALTFKASHRFHAPIVCNPDAGYSAMTHLVPSQLDAAGFRPALMQIINDDKIGKDPRKPEAIVFGKEAPAQIDAAKKLLPNLADKRGTSDSWTDDKARNSIFYNPAIYEVIVYA